MKLGCETCTVANPERLSIGTDATSAWRSMTTFALDQVPPGATVTDARYGIYWDGWCIAVSGPQCGGTSHQLDVDRLTSNSTTPSTQTFDPTRWRT